MPYVSVRIFLSFVNGNTQEFNVIYVTLNSQFKHQKKFLEAQWSPGNRSRCHLINITLILKNTLLYQFTYHEEALCVPNCRTSNLLELTNFRQLFGIRHIQAISFHSAEYFTKKERQSKLLCNFIDRRSMCNFY